MTLLQQVILVFILLQIVFGYFEYRYKPDLLYILGRLTNEKYLVPSLIVPVAYVFLTLLFRYLAS